MIVPTSFAADGDAAVAADETVENLTLTSDSSDILTADYYFDSNAADDTGDGSISDPYRDFKSSRVVANSNLYLANGEYTLDRSVSVNNVTIIGENPSQTILKYNYDTGFTVSSSLTLKNLTLVSLRITNNGELTATNTIFKDYKFGSYKGGVIESQRTNANTVLDNCTFNNTLGNYGGAIYLNQASLTVTDSVFTDTRANLFGGAIVGTNNANINIEDSAFLNTYSIDDAGGAIYLLNSRMIATNLEINNCSATFGGGIASLRSNLVLSSFTGRNNKAKYDGGAIYVLYEHQGSSNPREKGFFMSNSLLDNNYAENAGAIFVYNMECLIIDTTQFTNNRANDKAGAFYSVYLQEPYYDSILDKALKNVFLNNKAITGDDVLEVYLPDVLIGSDEYLLIQGNFSDVSSLPSRYDLRELGQVTSVKDQGNDGNCWAFSALGALESSIKKATGIEFDLSEENMKDLMGLYSLYGWNMETNAGGYDRMGYAYLVSWLGPVNDSDDKYKRDSVISPVLNSLIHVQNVLLFKRNNYTDNDAIKQAIMNYGGVSTSLYSTHQTNQYYTGTAGSNHAAIIVGWDDEREFSGAPGKGGWIVKNSWGTNFGDKGYFYVSYYDTQFAKPGKLASYVFVLNDTMRYDKNYQYDIPGRTDYLYNSSNVVWYKNRFTATDKEHLAAVSTYFEKDTDWELSVYVNNKLKLKQSGSSTTAYRTIELNKLIQLNKGDVFEIVFKITVARQAAVPISQSIPKGDIAALNTKFYSEDMSYISYDGTNWFDLNDYVWQYSGHEYESQVACIKAFTIIDKVNSSTELKALNNENPFEFEATVKDQYGSPINTGKVTFTVEGKDVNVRVANGIATLTHLFSSGGAKTVTAKFSGTGFYASSASIQVIVSKFSTGLTAPDVTTYYGGGGKVVATLKDKNGNAVSGVKVKVTAGSVSKTLTTSSKGQVSLSLDGFAIGEYTATFKFDGNDVYYPSSTTADVVITKVPTVLTAKDVVANYNVSSRLYVYLKDANGNPITGVKVKVVLGDIVKNIKTDAKGSISVSTLPLSPGSYTAFISCDGNDLYDSSSTTANVLVRGYPTVLSANDMVAEYNVSSKFYVYLTDGEGNPITGAKVNLVLGIINKTVKTDAKGRISASTKNLESGTYTAVATYAGSDMYAPSSTTAKVSVRYSTVLTANDVNAIYNVGSRLYATLKDSNGNPIVGAKVNLVLGNINKTVKTDASSRISASTKNLAIGKYVAVITFAGNEIYSPSSTTANVFVSSEYSFLSANDVVAMYNTTSRLYATLKDADGNPIVGAKVNLVLGNINKTVKTDSKGRISASTKNLGLGNYTAYASFAGTEVYAPSSVTASVVVSKIPTVLAAKDMVVDPNTNSRFYVTLKDGDGNPISGVKVHLVLGDIDKTVKTDANGRISASLKNLAAGSYTASISCAGTEIYGASSTTASVVIR
ncbi:Ig-like domain repeat protein [Methanobrevibacter sp.]|uniref:Ig-like domain repeat protein n=1 Tax=Methanobrevibacter sp. TaxID=66852 RepID=UPI00388DDB1F